MRLLPWLFAAAYLVVALGLCWNFTTKPADQIIFLTMISAPLDVLAFLILMLVPIATAIGQAICIIPLGLVQYFLLGKLLAWLFRAPRTGPLRRGAPK